MWTWNAACVVIGYLVATSAFTSPGLSSGAQSGRDASSSAVVAPGQALVRLRIPVRTWSALRAASAGR